MRRVAKEKSARGQSHYYAARETDANFLRAASPYARTGVEHERDLFYRGVGMFQAPLTLTLSRDEKELQLGRSSVALTKVGGSVSRVSQSTTERWLKFWPRIVSTRMLTWGWPRSIDRARACEPLSKRDGGNDQRQLAAGH